ncbi:NAD-dependent protein deacylase [Miniphocaeibacter massiliensis]|uniref:NAD-dependent protein deacylase n=1 Tax=Miniphocaeibacter massiliensis TaxID=2041841 RepID=UPI000C1C0977|nr:NAD-dependent protein deacylase [Miniphocaeibacter massiliensis]
MNILEELKNQVKNSNNIVFFGGAGVSTSSGIPDFRSATGLYNQKNKSNFSPEYMLSHEFFEKYPKDFMKYIKENLIYENVKPNAAHIGLSKLEKLGKLKGIITQNIDSLHQIAGSKNVVELHGNLRDFYCVNCGRNYSFDDVKKLDYTIECSECKGIIRPDVVLYGENLKEYNINKAVKLISEADILIVGGTSLKVYPAASFLKYYKGDKLVLINAERTDYDNMANYVFHEDIGEIISYLSDI